MIIVIGGDRRLHRDLDVPAAVQGLRPDQVATARPRLAVLVSALHLAGARPSYGANVADLEETMWRLDPWSGGGALTARASTEARRWRPIASPRDGRFYADPITPHGIDGYRSRSSSGASTR